MLDASYWIFIRPAVAWLAAGLSKAHVYFAVIEPDPACLEPAGRDACSPLRLQCFPASLHTFHADNCDSLRSQSESNGMSGFWNTTAMGWPIGHRKAVEDMVVWGQGKGRRWIARLGQMVSEHTL